MISQPELQVVIDDIKQVADRASRPFSDDDSDDSDCGSGDDHAENPFQPREYAIDRLHADDARDKVFVAILKALAARRNRPGSPKELATCIMKHEFTLLGGATPYATVSSRISQHFKRIFDHSPPRPPILGRVAHEKHTRKYFYYIASAPEQDDFQRKVRAGMIPLQLVSTGSGSGGPADGARKARSAKKPRCIVPAIAVESDLSPAPRSRRAASADPVHPSPRASTRVAAARPVLLGGADQSRRNTAPAVGLRPRRTSYEGRSATSAASSSDSDANPYARKRFRSVRSAVAHAYPRRLSRRQPAGDSSGEDDGSESEGSNDSTGSSSHGARSSNSAPGLGMFSATRVRRSASHGDASPGTLGPSSSPGRRPGPAGKWRPASDDEPLRSPGDAAGCCRRGPLMSATMLPPAVPHTTPCASASPDQTPFPPSTSPTVASFDPSDHDLNHLDSAEMQAASPLLLPRGLLALPLDTGLFDAPPSPPGKDDAIPSPADMATPFVTAAAAPAHTDDSVVPAALADSDLSAASARLDPAAHYAQTTATAATTATGAEQLHADMCALAAAPARPSSPAHGDVAGVAALDLEADSGFGFSFHELMDAELMSVNELETLWTTSNPVSDAAARYAALEPIPEAASEDAGDDDTCHEATASETSTAGVGRDDAGSTAYTATHDAEDCTSDEMPTQLTQKLLALSERPASAAGVLEGTGCRTPKQQASPAKAATAAVSPTRRPEPHRTTPALAAGDGTAAVQPERGDGPAALDSLEPTRMLVGSADEHEGVASAGPSSKVILPDPFADIPATAMVAMKLPVSPRIVLTIVETVPVYMTVITTTEPAADSPGKWIVRRHRLLRLVENGYVNASSLLLAGGVASEQERSIVLSLEVGRFKWRRPQSKLYGTWIPLPRARALAATCSLNHRLGPFLNDNLEAYFPAPLPTSFIRHLIMPFFSDQPAALLAADASAPPAAPATTAALSAAETAREAGLGIEFQHLVNSTVAGRSHQQAQSISRTSTFGSAARGMPSPSIIQSLAARGGPLGLAGAAKAIFGTDGRHLHSLLQLLSAESPMMGASLGAEPHRARTPGHEAPAASEADAESSAATPSNCVETPPTPLTAATAAAVLTVADELARSAIGDADKATGPIPTPPLSAVEKPGNKPGAVAGGKPHGRDSGAAHSPAVPSPVAGLRPGAMTTRSRRVSSAGRPPAAAAAALAKAARESSTGVDAQELSAAISSTLGGPVPAAAPLDDAMDCDVGGGNSSSAQRDSQDHSDDLDMSMVLPSSDNDVDMISRSTPPSPPMPPVTPPRFRRLSTAPLRISRSASVSSMAIDSAGDGAAGSSSSSHGDSDGDADSGGAEGSDAHTKPQQHCASGTFNARLLQTMEAYGFTGTAKTNMLLRLRAAAAAKSTGRQQAVAPYLLYRNGAGSSALGGVGSKRLKSAVDGDDSSGAQGSVRKRARVVRIPRAKPLPRQGAAAAVPKGRTKNNKLSTPADASAVLRLASAIYNHTLNMATLAQAQRQADSAHAASTAAAAPRPTAAPPPAVERRSPAPGSAGVSVRPPARAPTPMQRPPLRTPTQPGHGRPMLPPRPPPQSGAGRPPISPSIRGPPPPQQQQYSPGTGRPGAHPVRRPPMRPPGAASPQLPVRPGMPLRRPPPGGSPNGPPGGPRPMQQRPPLLRRPPPNTPPRPAMRPASPGQPVRPGARPPMPVGGSPLRTPPPPHPPKAEAPAPRPPPSVVTRHQRQQQQQQQQQAGPSASGN